MASTTRSFVFGRLAKVAKEFDLKLNPRGKFKVLVLTKREIIIQAFLSGTPDPIYIKHGNQKGKVSVNLVKYLQTKDYRKKVRGPHAQVVSKNSLKYGIRLLSKIPDRKVRKEAEILYRKIEKGIGKAKRLTLMWKPSKKEEKGLLRKEILLHEFSHEMLMDDNKIMPKSWKWNEGLVTYITHFVLGKHGRFENKPTLGENKMANIYDKYTHKWAKLLKGVKDPKARKRIILKKIRTVGGHVKHI